MRCDVLLLLMGYGKPQRSGAFVTQMAKQGVNYCQMCGGGARDAKARSISTTCLQLRKLAA
jgi:hypothetical protein